MSFGKLAQELKPKERVQSLSFTEAMAYLCTKLSYRDATDTINRFLYRPSVDHVRLRTVSDSMQRIGSEISDALAQSTEHILKMYGFHPQTGLPEENIRLSSNIRLPAPQEDPTVPLWKIQNVVEDINGSREEKIPFPAEDILIETHPETCVYVSIDDIGVKRQKDHRKDGSVRSTKHVENTVAHIQYGENTYVLSAIGMRNALKSVLAFLLLNNLLQYELLFLTDGAKDIKSHIEAVFAFHSHAVILDWYHLKKKCMEYLSMSVKGKEQRNAVLEKLLRYLWVGDVKTASEYLGGLKPSVIKNQKWIQELISYFERKGKAITCYAVRAKLNLRNSSNPVEKANDLLIAQRQKHNGMSWTPHGSGALAAVEMIYQNNQSNLWFQKKELLNFMPADIQEKFAA